ncbi:MAG: hypothetical protein V2A66_10155 [Pseudomonadota bacterium]
MISEQGFHATARRNKCYVSIFIRKFRLIISLIPNIIGVRDMKCTEFKKKLRKYPYITTAVFGSFPGSQKTLYNQINQWVKTGEVVKLRRGLYTLNEDDRKVGLSLNLAANAIYSPSYVSLESALSHYGMIPEAVFAVTSVTAKKTQSFSNPLGQFIYRSVKKAAFFGFTAVRDEFGFDCLVALPEKALLDYLYFNAPSRGPAWVSFFDESMRLQNADQLDLKKIEEMAAKMGSRKLTGAIAALKKWMKR